MNRRAFFAGLALAPIGVAGAGKEAIAKPVSIQLKGPSFDHVDVVGLLEQINGAVKDGHRLVASVDGRAV